MDTKSLGDKDTEEKGSAQAPLPGTQKASGTEWSGSLCPIDPDNFWIDDDTGERVNAWTGERTKQ